MVNIKMVLAVGVLISATCLGVVTQSQFEDSVEYTQGLTVTTSQVNTAVAQVPTNTAAITSLTPLTQVIVNSTNDLPAPTDTSDGLGVCYRLENKRYQIGNTIVFDYPIVPSQTFIESDGTSQLIYTGTGGFFRSNTNTPFSSLAIHNAGFIVTNASGMLLDLCAGTNLLFRFSVCSGNSSGGIGTIANVDSVVISEISFLDFTSGLVLSNLPISYFRGVAFAPGAPIADSQMTVAGAFLSNVFTDMQIIPVAGDAAFDIDPAISGRIEMGIVNVVTAFGGIPFKAGSLDQTDPKVYTTSCPNIPDSATIGGMYSESITAESDVLIVGESLAYQSVTNIGGGQIQLNSSETGALSDGSIVWLIDNDYTEKYEITNLVNDVSFEITSADYGQSSGDIHTGWVEVAGVTTANSLNQRCSMTDTNTLTFSNLETESIVFSIDYSIKTDSASASNIEVCLMKNNEIIRESIKPRVLTFTEVEGITQGASTIISGDEIKVFVRNLTDANRDIIMTSKNLIGR